MIQVSQKFLDAIESSHNPDGEKPIVLAFISSNMGQRVFGKVFPIQQWTGSSGGIILYNGTTRIGDGSLYGSESIIIDSKALAISYGRLRKTLVPEGNDLIASLKETEKTGNTLVLNNAGFYFSDILGNESFITQKIVLRFGFPSLSYADFITLYTGEIVEETNGIDCVLTSKAGSLQDLEQTYFIGRSNRYTNPQNQNEILPEIYGDCTKNSIGGPIKAVCIDTVNHYYLFSNSSVLSEANGNTITVYNKDGAVITSGFTIDTSFTDENGDVVSILDFTSQPDGDITVSCKGKDDGAGNLLENPIDIIEDLLDRMGVSDVRNSQAFAQSRQIAESQGYKAASVLLQEKKKSFWIKQVLNSFLGDFWHNAKDELVVSLDTLGKSTLNVSAFLDEGDINWQDVEPTRLRENICNQAVIRYAPFFTESDQRFSEGVIESWGKIDDGETSKDITSQNQYEIQERTFDLWWIRDDVVAQTVQESIIEAFKDNIWLLPLTENNSKHIYLEQGDYVVCSCRYLRDENGEELLNQVWRILEVIPDLDKFTQAYRLKDTGDYYPEPPVYYNGTARIGEYGGRGRLKTRPKD